MSRERISLDKVYEISRLDVPLGSGLGRCPEDTARGSTSGYGQVSEKATHVNRNSSSPSEAVATWKGGGRGQTKRRQKKNQQNLVTD